jgi:hypothetical protein
VEAWYRASGASCSLPHFLQPWWLSVDASNIARRRITSFCSQTAWNSPVVVWNLELSLGLTSGRFGGISAVCVPLVESLQRDRDGKVSTVPRTPFASGLQGWFRFFDQYRFLLGVVLPVVLLMSLPRFVSRKMWWSLAAIVAISGAVNIRVVWGHWASPFTEIVLGTAVVSFCLGLVAHSARQNHPGPRMNSWGCLAHSGVQPEWGGPLKA